DWHSVVSGDLRKQFVLKIFQALCPEVTQKCIDDYNKAYPSRVDYIKKSVNFSFETENDLFVNSKSKELYIGLIAEKIFTLREAISRFSTTTTTASSGGSSDSNDERRNSSGNNNGNIKRKLADVLKRTTRSIGSNE
uniref:KIX domain-containing protein n=1 Tax=Meloidogyne javanica TaxID=6303 RepID=A0A915M2S5_MELJA